ncbi:McrB family protein [Shouchella rhizosphaerae]|uniref:McrB family protein n=1 Tax=Shouchella rhizosphaerae TaxID=866786 RepID=UPI00203B8454|nr:AAA family ATPase [Shouchella rhizosphaerae]MCM3382138.1 AAA family ATPase [Shouchella rhizosphaerae]
MSKSEVEKYLEYTEYDYETSDVLVNSTLADLTDKINKGQDFILFGPPGTGKSYLVDQLHNSLPINKRGLVETIQFHSEYSYDDFIEGLSPQKDGGFKYENGVFFNFCDRINRLNMEAEHNKEKVNLFIIDEINRANITATFGEVMYLIEDKGIRTSLTAKSKSIFVIPHNVVIVGTMNTADKSLARLDFALRRRFRFLPINPNSAILKEIILKKGFDSRLDSQLSIDEYVIAFEKLNNKIRHHPLLGKELTIGHMLWVPKFKVSRKISLDDIEEIFLEIVFPQVQSYCGSNTETLSSLLGPQLRDALVYGNRISVSSIIALLKSLQNNKVGESNDIED